MQCEEIKSVPRHEFRRSRSDGQKLACDRRLPAGDPAAPTGKTGIQGMMKQFMRFQFEPSQVANLRMDTLLEAFDPNTIATPALRNYCGAVEIRFNLAEDGPHPILNVKLRQFLRVMARRWGPDSAPFFCELESPFILMYFTAQLDHLLVAEYAEGEDFVVRHRPTELQALRNSAQEGISKMGRRAGMTATEMRRQQTKISTLFETVFIYPFHD